MNRTGSSAMVVDADVLKEAAIKLLRVDHPYAYQLRVARRLLDGENVLLQAPTGAGKTMAALLPFLFAKHHGIPFADRLIYAAPMRTLVTSLAEEARSIVAAAGLADKLTVTVQTGSQPEDPFLEGDIVFTTIDQLLSAYIGSPVSLPGRNANIVGAAAIGAYIVFDEFHLLEPDRALSTAIDLATRLRGFSRVLLMSATITSRAAELICQRAKATFEPVRDEELTGIPSQRNKVRRFHYVAEPITAQSVLNRHRRRTIAVVNTVNRAQQLYRDLVDLFGSTGPTTHLLHARFLPADRKATEQWALKTFARGSCEEGILVATQVIEVGLNLSAQTLHTELAPAAAVFQRAGRCARFEGEEGDVYVYELPTNDAGEFRIAPYEPEEREPIMATAKEIAMREGRHCAYADERAVAEATYGAYDTRLLGETDVTEFRQRVNAAMASIDRAAPRELIRDADSVFLAVHTDPIDVPARSRLESFPGAPELPRVRTARP